MTKFEPIVVTGELIHLSEEDRIQFYRQVCTVMGLDFRTRPLQYFEQIDHNNKRNLILYALRTASTQLAQTHRLSVDATLVDPEFKNEEAIFKSIVTDKEGRTYSSYGAQSLKGLSGKVREDAIMAAQTKADRRAILNFVGSGLLDESEVEGMNGSPVEMKSDLIDSYVPPPPTPVSSSAPAIEVLEKLPDAVYDPTPPSWPIGETLEVTVEGPSIDSKITEAANSLTAGMIAGLKAESQPGPTMDQITARLNTYRRDVLQRGGMRPAKGLGIAAKWEKFRARKVSAKTVEEYAKLLSELDAVLAKSGDVGVVAFIEKEIA